MLLRLLVVLLLHLMTQVYMRVVMFQVDTLLTLKMLNRDFLLTMIEQIQQLSRLMYKTLHQIL